MRQGWRLRQMRLGKEKGEIQRKRQEIAMSWTQMREKSPQTLLLGMMHYQVQSSFFCLSLSLSLWLFLSLSFFLSRSSSAASASSSSARPSPPSLSSISKSFHLLLLSSSLLVLPLLLHTHQLLLVLDRLAQPLLLPHPCDQ